MKLLRAIASGISDPAALLKQIDYPQFLTYKKILGDGFFHERVRLDVSGKRPIGYRFECKH
jgi:hypothetical protein